MRLVLRAGVRRTVIASSWTYSGGDYGTHSTVVAAELNLRGSDRVLRFGELDVPAVPVAELRTLIASEHREATVSQ
ncbi:hypothetical protein C449_05512 [Halococcus saccharolyticus DSM 5350]|uniref:Uncharacterized protein n=1 Tax=Halococcus saccharolyticus DSM 5350 TaxID=1227455 RepID=M0MKC7_9EURY|nr:hypothetical protein C449_05512 [Halococcus saccharolyticus DSM 5350]